MARSPRSPRWSYATAGLIAAVAGIGVGQLVGALLNPSAAPLAAIGSSVVDLTPTPVKEWAVATFGTADKPVLLTGVVVVTLGLCALIGLLARRHTQPALVLVGSLGAIAALAAANRPSASPFDIFPGFVAALAGMIALLILAGRARRVETAGSEKPQGPVESPTDHTAYAPGVEGKAARRSFLLAAGGLGVGGVAAASLGAAASIRHPDPATLVSIPPVPDPLPALPAGLEAQVPGISPLRTPNADFYRIDTALSVPRIDPAGWRLTIDGQVGKRIEMTYADLLAMPLIESDITINCVSNEIGGPYISSTRWTGVLVADILARADIQPGADQILSTSVDGMTISTPVEALTDRSRGAILAVEMGGVPLPAEHGFPVRLVTPGLYGFVGATKWLTKLTATTYAAQQAYWTQRGWAEKSPVLVQSRIDTPSDGTSVKAGTVAIGGVAWAQGSGGVQGVEVRVDDGPWQAATLGPQIGAVYWRQWWWAWPATSGQHRLSVRAIDGTGQPQTEQIADPYPSGATGLHTVSVKVD